MTPAARVPLAVFAVAAVVLAYLCARVADWAVMTDELLYERLAISIATGGVPRLHGEVTDTLGLLYPLLIAPVFAAVDLPGAIRVVHGLNGVLFASASIPAWLLARELALPRLAAAAAAVFAVVLPWTVIAAFVMTEVAAYPVSLWAVLAIQRAVALPGPRRDAVALGAIAAAALARPQLAVLGVVLVAAAVAQELRLGRWRAHAVAFGAAAVVLLVLALGGAGLLGSYSATLEEGSLLTWDALEAAVLHVDLTAVALGIAPLVLGLGWALATLVRPGDDATRSAFAAVVAATVVVLALQSGSVVVRFGLGEEVKDRYVFYVAPLLVVAALCALDDRRPRVLGMVGVAAFFVLTIGLEDFDPVFGVNLDTPASSTHEALARFGLESGVPPADAIAVLGGVVAAVLFFGLRRAPVVAVGVLALALLFVAAETAYTWNRLLTSSSPSGRALTTPAPAELAWVDRAAGEGRVGLVAHFEGQEWFPNAIRWWDTEFWNATVERGYLLGPYFAYTPGSFPRGRLQVDPLSGELRGADGVDLLVRSASDARFGPAGSAVASHGGLELVALELPPRASWLTLGLDPDGWTRPGRGAFVRVFGRADATRVRLTLEAAEAPASVAVGGSTAEVAAHEQGVVVVDLCVPEGGRTDLRVDVDGTARIRAIATAPPYSERYREVGVRVRSVEAAGTGQPCSP